MVGDLLDHRAGGTGALVLRGALRNAVVADHRIRKGENLSGVRRIGQRLFVSRHAGVKDGFAQRQSVRAQTVAVETAAVGKKSAAGVRAFTRPSPARDSAARRRRSLPKL